MIQWTERVREIGVIFDYIILHLSSDRIFTRELSCSPTCNTFQ